MVAELIIIIASQGDFAASDPLWYADIAHHISLDAGEFFTSPPRHPFQMRVGLTLPLSLIYRVFGVSLLTTNLPSILAALGVMLVVYAAAPTPRAKLIGLVLVLACTPLVRHASMLNVDLPAAALMAGVTLFLARRWVLLAMVTWFAAFLVKETGLWCAPLWIYVIVVDARATGLRTAARRYAPAFAVGAALAITYLVVCARIWGDPWARFAGIEELTDGHAWSMTDKSAAQWIERLGWATPVALGKLFLATLIPAVLAPWLVRREDRIWLVSTGSILALFWFGSTSLSAYAPLPMSARMMLPVLPGILVLATLGTEGAIDRLRGSRWQTPLLVVFAAAVLVPGALSIRFLISRPRPETDAYAIVRHAVADPARRVVLVCGDPRCSPISTFHFGFAPPPNLTILFAGNFAAMQRPAGITAFVMVNLRRGAGAEWVDPATDPLGYKVDRIEELRLPVLLRHGSVRLYDGGDGVRLWEALRGGT
ncbi:MAG: hypothetical protein H0T42_00680 [Deltaproteobacteria bacterium]|nr:hypothetical protein [Deltaproteobacteria bacterium]